MLGFKKLAIASGSRGGFVGICAKSDKDCAYHTPVDENGNSTHEFTFHLPKNFHGYGVKDGKLDYNLIRDLFFKLYRGFARFERDNFETSRFRKNKPEYQQTQDQTIQSPGGISGYSDKSGDCLLYSKLKNIERIFKAYSDLSIHNLEQKTCRHDNVDYSQLYRYLDKGIFLENDVVYIDEMNLPRNVVLYDPNDLIDLYSFILNEILVQLQDDIIDSPFDDFNVADLIRSRREDIRHRSDVFREKYLYPGCSLFDDETGEETENALKEILESINEKTAYKDADYWQLFEAVEAFLYGELDPDKTDGDFWGIQGFSFLWEDLCHTWFFKNKNENVVYADSDLPIASRGENPKRRGDSLDAYRVGNVRVGSAPIQDSEGNEIRKQVYIYSEPSGKDLKYRHLHPVPDQKPVLRDIIEKRNVGFHELLKLTFDGNPSTLYFDSYGRSTRSYNHRDRAKLSSRKLQPDLITKQGFQSCIIWDFKDVDLSFFRESSSKLRYDINKSLAYEFALQAWFTVGLGNNRFLVPVKETTNSALIENLESSSAQRRCRGVAVWGLNLNEALNLYISEKSEVEL
jgi:hypothetical protein